MRPLLFFVLVALICWLLLSPWAGAQGEPTEPALPDLVLPIGVIVLIGVGAAALRVFYGWISTDQYDTWSWLKVLRTLGASVIAGGIIALYKGFQGANILEVALQLFAGTISLDDLMSRVPKVAKSVLAASSRLLF